MPRRPSLGFSVDPVDPLTSVKRICALWEYRRAGDLCQFFKYFLADDDNLLYLDHVAGLALSCSSVGLLSPFATFSTVWYMLVASAQKAYEISPKKLNGIKMEALSGKSVYVSLSHPYQGFRSLRCPLSTPSVYTLKEMRRSAQAGEKGPPK